nr:hypothetical protein [uncultured Desulfobulbus sp.]
MNRWYFIGLDLHKKMIAYCIKTIDGRLIEQGMVASDRTSLKTWAKGLPGPWIGAMEATMFTGWVYDFLAPYAVELKVAHPEMLRAITAAKKKTIGPMRKELPISCGSTSYRNAPCFRKKSGNCGGFCDIATTCYEQRSECTTKCPVY